MPSDLSEHEIWDRLRTSLRTAIDLCGRLAIEPGQGPNYLQMIKELEMLEGASRQFAFCRSDIRWTKFGFEMHRFRQRIGDAIRAHHSRDIFLHMQKMMRQGLVIADKMKDAKTGRLKAILPKVQQGPLRHHPVYVKNPSGLLLPAASA